MFPLSLNFPKFAGAGAIIALIVSGSPAHADEMAQNLGPVGPHEPIITMVGSKRVTGEAVADTGQQASVEGSNAQDASAAMERQTHCPPCYAVERGIRGQAHRSR
jgi:hypothetical protein